MKIDILWHNQARKKKKKKKRTFLRSWRMFFLLFCFKSIKKSSKLDCEKEALSITYLYTMKTVRIEVNDHIQIITEG